MNKNRGYTEGSRSPGGFTLIELMIVVAIIAIILGLALPVYTNYTTRAKVGEALSVAAAAKTAASATCVEDPTVNPLSNTKAGYAYTSSEYVLSVDITGPCSDPVITVVTQNIGVTPNITVTLTGDFGGTNSRLNWVCTSNTGNYNLPRECRT